MALDPKSPAVSVNPRLGVPVLHSHSRWIVRSAAAALGANPLIAGGQCSQWSQWFFIISHDNSDTIKLSRKDSDGPLTSLISLTAPPFRSRQASLLP